jgi:hypothetical protein
LASSDRRAERGRRHGAVAGWVLCLVVAGCASVANVVNGAEPPESLKSTNILSLTFENDLFANADRHYTNGVRLGYLSAEEDLPRWVDKLANAFPLFLQGGSRRIGFALGQSMYTPGDISRANPDPNDRPYAGWLYGSVGVVAERGPRLDILQLDFGVVGPAAQADSSQKLVHRLTGAKDPRGWAYQIENEPGIVLTYQRKWRGLYELSPFGFGADVTPYGGGSVGNVLTQAVGGAMVRFGLDLPADYGPPRVAPALTGSDFYLPRKEFGWYLFAGIEGRAVARNIFLDGNTWKHSRSVDKKPLVGDLQVGIAVTIEDVRLSYTHVFMTKEFHGQARADSFGAFSVSFLF